VLGLALAGLVLVADTAAGQLFVPSGRDTLRALSGVEVIVESVPPALAGRGLTQASIKADVVRGLEAGGVRVYPSQAANLSAAKAYLDVHVTAIASPGQGGYIVAVQMDLRQTLASLVTESKIVNASTWDAGSLVAWPAGRLSPVRDEIRTAVDEFVEDWKSVH